MSTRYFLYPDGIHKTWSERPWAKCQRSGSPSEAPPTKKVYEMTLAEQVQGQRPVLKAELNWRSSNHTVRCHGTFMWDTGCTGPIVSEDFVKKEKIPLERRKSPIQMIDAQGDLMMGAGAFCTSPLE
jgi:hypothetical protein